MPVHATYALCVEASDVKDTKVETSVCCSITSAPQFTSRLHTRLNADRACVISLSLSLFFPLSAVFFAKCQSGAAMLIAARVMCLCSSHSAVPTSRSRLPVWRTILPAPSQHPSPQGSDAQRLSPFACPHGESLALTDYLHWPEPSERSARNTGAKGRVRWGSKVQKSSVWS